MTSLVDKLVPDDLWAIVKPYCHHHTAHPTAADTAPSPTAMLRRHRVHDPHLNSLPWRLLPARELGCGSPATA
jgi:hypothetical protein